MNTSLGCGCGRSPRRAGFTLIELLVVVGIIGILVGISLKISGYANRKAASGKAASEIEGLKIALEEYRQALGRYYTNNVTFGVDVPGFSNAVSGYGGNLSFTDPWGRPYQYRTETPFMSYRLWSHGVSDTTDVDNVDAAAGLL